MLRSPDDKQFTLQLWPEFRGWELPGYKGLGSSTSLCSSHWAARESKAMNSTVVQTLIQSKSYLKKKGAEALRRL